MNRRAQNAQKAKSGYQAGAYTIEWTHAVCEFLKTLLAEIVLPSDRTLRQGITIQVKGKAKATLTEPDLRARWTSRFASTCARLNSPADITAYRS